ncbi:hypothetical protein EDB86DRAFT_2828513 [Lactarius hatsudake]|nr:hypothetical protein EDB86DRAFT_2828513 [Lactarius hatsudake]
MSGGMRFDMLSAYPVTRLANGDCGAVIGVHQSAENLAKSRHALQRRLDEIDLSSDNISDRLIKLECGHIFTVETLDGNCNMSEYYESDAMGTFTAMKAPPVNFQTPPSCPACCGPITALRYGRVTKRANLDILEQNVASTMSSAIEEVGPEIEELSRRLDNVKEEAKSIAFNPPSEDADDFDALSARRKTRFGPESEPLPHKEISHASMRNVYGFSGEEGRAWNKVVRDLLKLYKKVADVARTRGPHVQAYGAALATLYRLELSAIASDPERATDTPEPAAMMEVNKKIGQPPHKADTRFQVEAFFLSLELRYTLAEIAQSRIEGLSIVSSENLRHERLWRSFVSFIYESCIRDAEKALKIAEKSSAPRLAAQAGMNILRGKLELFRFEILTDRTLLFRQGLLDNDRRNELSTKVQLESNTASCEMKKLETTYFCSIPVTDTAELGSESVWFTQKCRERGDKFIKEYNALVRYLCTEGGYEPLSLEEREIIVKSFGFSHGGHFYNCENGHTFVIGEVRKPLRSPNIQTAHWDFTVRKCSASGALPRMQGPDRGLQPSNLPVKYANNGIRRHRSPEPVAGPSSAVGSRCMNRKLWYLRLVDISAPSAYVVDKLRDGWS